MHNDGISYRIFTVCNTILLILLSLLFAYPVLYVLFASLSDSNKLMGHMGLLLKPLDANLNSYRAVFKNPMILHGYGNTLFVVVMGLALSMVLTVLCAYVLSRKELALRRAHPHLPDGEGAGAQRHPVGHYHSGVPERVQHDHPADLL